MSQHSLRTYPCTVKTSARGVVYGDRGVGPPVVVLHGWCLNRGLWMYLEEHLLARHRVVSPDLPGFGASQDLDGPYDLDRYVDDLDALLAELGLEPVVIVGFAFGAAVAMGLAARQEGPNPRASGLVLIGVPSAQHAPYQRMPRAMRRDWPEFARRSASAICRQPHSDATLEWLADMFRSTPLPVALQTVELLGRFEPVPLAASIGTRTLFIHGEQDDVVPVAVSRACAEQMERATVVEVADSGHLVVLDQKERLAELVDQFLSGVPASASASYKA
jgi:non-heme chloroperoxidase